MIVTPITFSQQNTLCQEEPWRDEESIPALHRSNSTQVPLWARAKPHTSKDQRLCLRPSSTGWQGLAVWRLHCQWLSGRWSCCGCPVLCRQCRARVCTGMDSPPTIGVGTLTTLTLPCSVISTISLLMKNALLAGMEGQHSWGWCGWSCTLSSGSSPSAPCSPESQLCCILLPSLKGTEIFLLLVSLVCSCWLQTFPSCADGLLLYDGSHTCSHLQSSSHKLFRR